MEPNPPLLSEAEQRARVRDAALRFEQELGDRIEAGEVNLEQHVADVQKTLERLGRKPTFSENLEVIRDRESRRAREVRARAAATKLERRA